MSTFTPVACSGYKIPDENNTFCLALIMKEPLKCTTQFKFKSVVQNVCSNLLKVLPDPINLMYIHSH